MVHEPGTKGGGGGSFSAPAAPAANNENNTTPTITRRSKRGMHDTMISPWTGLGVTNGRWEKTKQSVGTRFIIRRSPTARNHSAACRSLRFCLSWGKKKLLMSTKATTTASDQSLWGAYIMALDEVTDRLRRITLALDEKSVPYAVVGGQAVALWVATKEPAAVRTTKDVDLMIRRADLPQRAPPRCRSRWITSRCWASACFWIARIGIRGTPSTWSGPARKFGPSTICLRLPSSNGSPSPASRRSHCRVWCG